MSDVPANLRYTEEHEWVKVEGNVATVGITDHAQHALGDIVYVELPKVDRELAQKATAGVIESVKAAADMYSPLSGKVVAVNEALDSGPEAINKFPYEDGWMFKLALSKPAELESLLDVAGYEKLLAEA